MTQFHPRNDHILVLPDESERMKGSLYVPESYARPQTRGTVVAVGPGYLLADGSRADMDLEQDDRVEFRLVPGMPVIMLDGEAYMVLKEADIVGKVTDEPVEMMMPDADVDAGAPMLATG